MPMWFRGADLTLQLVNQAYVDAVGAQSAAEVVEGQVELLEAEDELAPSDIARATLQSQEKSERIVAATIHGARRTLRVSDLPLGQEGVAGYAIDIEEQGPAVAGGRIRTRPEGRWRGRPRRTWSRLHEPR